MLNKFKKAKNIIGIDFATSAIKVINASVSDNSIAIKFYDEEPIEYATDGKIEKQNKKLALETLIKRKNLHKISKNLVISIPTHNVIPRYLSMPAMPEERMEQMIHYEAEQHIPFPIHEVVLDFNILSKNEEQVEVLIVAIKKDKLDEYIDIVTEAGLTPERIDVSLFSVFNLINYSKICEENDPYLLIDFGAGTTDIAIFKNNILYVTRSVSVSGISMTEALVKKLDIDFNIAEKLKLNKSIIKTDDSIGESAGEKKGKFPSMKKTPAIGASNAAMPSAIPAAAPGIVAPSAPKTPEIKKPALSVPKPPAKEEPKPQPAPDAKPDSNIPMPPPAPKTPEIKKPALSVPKPPAKEEPKPQPDTDAKPDSNIPMPPPAPKTPEIKKPALSVPKPPAKEEPKPQPDTDAKPDSNIPMPPPAPKTPEIKKPALSVPKPPAKEEPKPQPDTDAKPDSNIPMPPPAPKTPKIKKPGISMPSINKSIEGMKTPHPSAESEKTKPEETQKQETIPSKDENPKEKQQENIKPKITLGFKREPTKKKDDDKSLGAAQTNEEVLTQTNLPDISEDEMHSILKPFIDRLSGELKRSIEFFNSNIGKEQIKKILITGGVSNIPGLKEYLQQKLKQQLFAEEVIPLQEFDCSSIIKNPDAIDKTTASTALGLSLYQLLPEFPTIKINLVPPDILLKKRAQAAKKKGIVAGILYGLFILLLIAFGVIKYLNQVEDNKIVKKQLKEMEIIVQKVEDLKKDRDALSTRLEVIQELNDKKSHWLDIFKEIDSIFSEEKVWFTNYIFPVKTKMKVDGYTETFGDVGRMVELFNKSKYFTVASVPKQSSIVLDDKNYVKFQFEVAINHNPSEGKKISGR